jgi:formylglycine-generating enzyme
MSPARSGVRVGVGGRLALLAAVLVLAGVTAVGTSAQAPSPLDGLSFVTVSAGCFQMGDTFGEGQKDELPVHEVCVNRFSMAATVVTVGQFGRFVAATGYRTEAERGDGCTLFDGKTWARVPGTNWKNPGFTEGDNHPAVCVSWNDAQAYIGWVNRQTGGRYRLPTEAEWEFAARSGGKAERYAGTSDTATLFRFANFCDVNCPAAWKVATEDDHQAATAPVATYAPNGLGLYEMCGNAWQWTGDWYDATYYAESPRDDPRGPVTGTGRVIRGGSWNRHPLGVRAAVRFIHDASERGSGLGIRLVTADAGK